jgi:hypothetical protein
MQRNGSLGESPGDGKDHPSQHGGSTRVERSPSSLRPRAAERRLPRPRRRSLCLPSPAAALSASPGGAGRATAVGPHRAATRCGMARLGERAESGQRRTTADQWRRHSIMPPRQGGPGAWARPRHRAGIGAADCTGSPWGAAHAPHRVRDGSETVPRSLGCRTGIPWPGSPVRGAGKAPGGIKARSRRGRDQDWGPRRASAYTGPMCGVGSPGGALARCRCRFTRCRGG